MKGVVFTEFLEMVEDRFSADLADRVIDGCDLASNGAYTSVGTYDHREFVQLVERLGQETEIPVSSLLRDFGEHLFGRFAANYGMFFEGVHSTFPFLKSVEEHIERYRNLHESHSARSTKSNRNNSTQP